MRSYSFGVYFILFFLAFNKKIFLGVIIFLIVISQYIFFFLLYSMVTKLHIHVCTGLHRIVVWQCKYLDRILNATQQDLIVHPFQDQ